MAKSTALLSEDVLAAANKFISFINKSPSPFHAVDQVKQCLNVAGFKELKETEKWNIKPLDKFYVTRNLSTIIAFAVGAQYKPGNGFTIIGAHTDSPCLKLKPVSTVKKAGFLQVGVQCYGGGIWMTWFDRDLTIAGRVIVKEGESVRQKLIHIERPILRVPNLAIHLQREVNDKFSINKETHLCPLLATSIAADLGVTKPEEDDTENATTATQRHHSVLIKLICDELEVTADQIVDLELCLADTQPAVIGGALKEFIFSPRLDNLMNSYAACEALVETCTEESLASEANVRMISLFDNEEVGSLSAQGAESKLQELVMRRIAHNPSDSTAFEESIAKSLMVSADMSHAVHPNYADKHESNHQVSLHKGVAIKTNCNQRYATTGLTCAIMRVIAEQAGVNVQDYAVRNDGPCGTTIGPILSASLGLPTVDVGAPQLSMHSIREMCCTTGLSDSIKLFKAFMENFPAVRDSIA